MRATTVRRIVHAAVFGFVFLLPVIGRWGMVGAAAAFAVINAFVLPRLEWARRLRRPDEGRPWNGLVAYPVAVALGFAVFREECAVTAWGVMAFADPVASLVGGSRKWSLRIPWNRDKSLAGSTAFLVVATAVQVPLALLYWEHLQDLYPGDIYRFDPRGPFEILFDPSNGALALSGLAALAGAITESLPWKRDDNLAVMIAVAGTVSLLAAIF